MFRGRSIAPSQFIVRPNENPKHKHKNSKKQTHKMPNANEKSQRIFFIIIQMKPICATHTEQKFSNLIS